MPSPIRALGRHWRASRASAGCAPSRLRSGRMRRGRQPALRPVGQPHGPQRLDAARAVRRHDGDALRDGRQFHRRGLRDHRRRDFRRSRRAHRPAAQIDLELWRRARQPVRFRQLRRGAGGGAVSVDDVGLCAASAGRSCCSTRCAARCGWRGSTPRSAADRPAYASPFFTGVPAPAGAGLVMVPMFLSFEWGDWLFRSPYLSAVIGDRHRRCLMVSTVPTVSLKRFRIPHHLVVPTLLGIGVLAAFVTTAPWPTLTVDRPRLCRLDPADDARRAKAAPRRRSAPGRARRGRSAGAACRRLFFGRTRLFDERVLWTNAARPPASGGTDPATGNAVVRRPLSR